MTENLYDRLKTYLTGCPPGLTPSQDIEYDAVWETNAMSRYELYDIEATIHDKFTKFRMFRENHGKSEWFNFQGKNAYEIVNPYIERQPWFKRQVPLSEIIPTKKPTRYLRKPYSKNLESFIQKDEPRIATLKLLQTPVISAIATFIADADIRAGYIVAPCGSGKTKMTTNGIRGIKKCIICCPSKQIQIQWLNTLIAEGNFIAPNIHIVGGAGTTNPQTIREIFENETFCIISTYMSSHLLVDIITPSLELLILDEAHHMAGIVAKQEEGEGITRRLLLKASELGVKRLSLTYTPRFVANDRNADVQYLTMDDDAIFGKKIAELKIRNLIESGVLPDYRLWLLRDEAKKGMGIIAKAECILESWNATEIVRDEEKHILHHLIVFASTVREAKELEVFFKANTTDTLVLRVGEGDSLEKPIADFTAASRAILVNCLILNEGVDIPIANAVAITYPKQSRGQITQMVLRAGRWHEGKSVFHVLIPTLGVEDLSGFEEVLTALASADDKLCDEIILHAKSESTTTEQILTTFDIDDTSPECIMIEEFEADEEAIKKCFTNVRTSIFPANVSRRIQELCLKEKIDTSVDYANMRRVLTHLPEDPRPKGILWYDFLHPTHYDRISTVEFVRTFIDPNNIRVGHLYELWREQQPSEIHTILPTVQHITDGFFGRDDTNFNSIREKFGKKIASRGR